MPLIKRNLQLWLGQKPLDFEAVVNNETVSGFIAPKPIEMGEAMKRVRQWHTHAEAANVRLFVGIADGVLARLHIPVVEGVWM